MIPIKKKFCLACAIGERHYGVVCGARHRSFSWLDVLTPVSKQAGGSYNDLRKRRRSTTTKPARRREKAATSYENGSCRAFHGQTLPITTTKHVFKVIKDEILKLRDEGQALLTFKELRDLLWHRLSGEPRFGDETLKAVIGLLDGPGAVKELDYGTFILLQPEWINIYAQAVIRTLRSSENELGCLPLRSIAEGKLVYQSVGRGGDLLDMKRLAARGAGGTG